MFYGHVDLICVWIFSLECIFFGGNGFSTKVFEHGREGNFNVGRNFQLIF